MSQNDIKRLGGIKGFILDMVLGGSSAAITKTLMAPIERVKLVMQTSANIQSSTLKKQIPKSQQYSGITDCLKKLYQNEGFISYWRGNGVNVTRYFPMSAINFAVKEKLSIYMVPSDPRASKKRVLFGTIMAGGISGMISLFSIYPMDYGRTRLAADTLYPGKGGRQFNGLIDAISKTYHQDGFIGCYKGVIPAMGGVFVFRGLWFGFYDFFKKVLIKDETKSNRILRFCIGSVVSIGAGYVCYPLDTSSRRIMMQQAQKKKLYKNPVDCLIKMYKNEGIRGIYNGSLSNAIRSLGGSLILVLFDDFKKISMNIINKKKH